MRCLIPHTLLHNQFGPASVNWGLNSQWQKPKNGGFPTHVAWLQVLKWCSGLTNRPNLSWNHDQRLHRWGEFKQTATQYESKSRFQLDLISLATSRVISSSQRHGKPSGSTPPTHGSKDLWSGHSRSLVSPFLCNHAICPPSIQYTFWLHSIGTPICTDAGSHLWSGTPPRRPLLPRGMWPSRRVPLPFLLRRLR